MDMERLLREVEKRLGGLDEAHKAEALDAMREEFARERRRVTLSLTVETERERRVEAETLKDVLEAINRQARLEDTIEEVLKQLARIVTFDSCSLALADTEGRFRIIAARGFPDPSKIIGVSFRDPVSDAIRENRWPMPISDVKTDDRFVKVAGTEFIRSWAGIPLLVEGEVIGMLALDRYRVDPFGEEDLHRAKAVVFSAAAAIRKAQLLEQIRRYASLLERVVAVDQAVFAGDPVATVAGVLLEGAMSLAESPGGLLVLIGPDGPRVAAARGDMFHGALGRPAPTELAAVATTRLGTSWVAGVGTALGLTLPAQAMLIVPLPGPGGPVGTLVLLDPVSGTHDDRLVEAYASRAVTAYLHAAHTHTRP
jgi:GAF domain-containing protein